MEGSNDLASKKIWNEKNTRDSELGEINSKKIKKDIDKNDSTKNEITKKIEREKIDSMKDFKAKLKFELNSKNPQKSIECINDEKYSYKKEIKKIFFKDNIIVKKIFFFLPRKEIIRTIKKVKEFYFLGNEDYSEEDELYYLSKIKPKGLKNIDGTCYMNSTLQCFYHIKDLTDYFLKIKKKLKEKMVFYQQVYWM